MREGNSWADPEYKTSMWDGMNISELSFRGIHPIVMRYWWIGGIGPDIALSHCTRHLSLSLSDTISLFVFNEYFWAFDMLNVKQQKVKTFADFLILETFITRLFTLVYPFIKFKSYSYFQFFHNAYCINCRCIVVLNESPRSNKSWTFVPTLQNTPYKIFHHICWNHCCGRSQRSELLCEGERLRLLRCGQRWGWGGAQREALGLWSPQSCLSLWS